MGRYCQAVTGLLSVVAKGRTNGVRLCKRPVSTVIWPTLVPTATMELFREGRLLDFQLVLPIVFLLLFAAGLVYAVFASYVYFRSERSAIEKNVPVAMAALTIHYVLLFGFPYVRGFVLVPTLLLFLMALAPLVAIWVGSRARSKAGRRIAWAGAFTLAAFICRTGYEIHTWS